MMSWDLYNNMRAVIKDVLWEGTTHEQPNHS